MTQIDLTIVICTFHREQLLAKALASIARQSIPETFVFDVVVVDNSDGETARPIVEKAAADASYRIRYTAAHPANISVARNAGVNAASARWIGFLDDDQEMESGWIAAVAGAIAATPFDALFGSVTSTFETPDRATAITRHLFCRQLPAPTGEELFAMGRRKMRSIALATNNALFRASAIGPSPFDPDFGHAGGEDYDLVCRMQQRGSRFGWLPEAKATEFVPASRCDARYLRQRFFTGGQVFAKAVSQASPAPGRTRWILRAKAAIQVLMIVAQYPVVALRGWHAMADHSFRLAGACGKLSLANVNPLYRLS